MARERVELDYWYQYNYCSASPWEGFRPIKNLKIEKKKIVTMVTEKKKSGTGTGGCPMRAQRAHPGDAGYDG